MNKLDAHYLPPNPQHWQGRSDSAPNERFFQAIQLVDLQQVDMATLAPGLIIIGFACDEGVVRNLGRAGAADGPSHIRLQLAKLPYISQLPLYDIGDIVCLEQDLDGAQKALGKLLHLCHSHQHKTLVLGGGHETAWGHYQGLKSSYSELSFINFDAHFDLRKSEIATSGTPFYQIAEDKQKLNQPFHYLCYGIQKFANTKTLFDTAKELNVQFVGAQKIHKTDGRWQQSYIDDFINQKRHIYLSICLDVFSSAHAPGVSAPQPMGLAPWQVLPILQYILSSEKVVSVDIVELAPNYDIDEQTARLAGLLAAEVAYAI